MADISVVILTFNSEKFIIPCLDSLFSQDTSAREVVIVDNGSHDATVSLIKSKYPQAKLILNERNVGACKARNQGIAASNGAWVLTLDSDVVLEKSFLSQSLHVVAGAPENTGIVQPKILSIDARTVYSAGIRLSFLRRFRDIGHGCRDSGALKGPAPIFGACCAAALYRRKMLQEVQDKNGYFDERFFFLVEDVDLSWRAQRHGWKAMFFPQLICFHSGDSSATDKKVRQYLCFRNRYYMIAKNEGFARYALKIIPLLAYDLPRACYLLCTNRYVLTGYQQ